MVLPSSCQNADWSSSVLSSLQNVDWLDLVQVLLWVHECNSQAVSGGRHCIKPIFWLLHSFLPLFLDVSEPFQVVVFGAVAHCFLPWPDPGYGGAHQRQSPLWYQCLRFLALSPLLFSDVPVLLTSPSALSVLCLESSRPWHCCMSSQEVKKLFFISSS